MCGFLASAILCGFLALAGSFVRAEPPDTDALLSQAIARLEKLAKVSYDLHPDDYAGTVRGPEFAQIPAQTWIKVLAGLDPKNPDGKGVLKRRLIWIRLALGNDPAAREVLKKATDDIDGSRHAVLSMTYLPVESLRAELLADPTLLDQRRWCQLLAITGNAATLATLKERRSLSIERFAARKSLMEAIEYRLHNTPGDPAEFREKELRIWRARFGAQGAIIPELQTDITMGLLSRCPPMGREFLRTRWLWPILMEDEAKIGLSFAAAEAYPEALSDLARFAAERSSKDAVRALEHLRHPLAARKLEELIRPGETDWNDCVLGSLCRQGDRKSLTFLAQIRQDPRFESSVKNIDYVAALMAGRIELDEAHQKEAAGKR